MVIWLVIIVDKCKIITAVSTWSFSMYPSLDECYLQWNTVVIVPPVSEGYYCSKKLHSIPRTQQHFSKSLRINPSQHLKVVSDYCVLVISTYCTYHRSSNYASRKKQFLLGNVSSGSPHISESNDVVPLYVLCMYILCVCPPRIYSGGMIIFCSSSLAIFV